MGAVLLVLAINLALATVLFLILWRIAVRLGDPSFVDSWWPAGMVVMAWTSLVLAPERGPRAWLLAALATAWGLRLALHLFRRWRRNGPDRRYVTMMAKARSERGWSFATASLLLVFALQLPLQFIVCLPVQLGPLGGPPGLGVLSWIGAAAAVVGIAFETVGDAQLERFKADPASAGKVLDSGLWRYTRHPNYFGDALTWWGLALIAADGAGPGLWAIPGPMLLTFLLTRFSGVPTVEGRMRRRRPDYEAYVASTSPLIPWPPKRA